MGDGFALSYEGQRMTLEQYVERYALTHEISKGYEQQLRIAARIFDEWSGGIPVKEITGDHVNRWLIAISGNGRTPATIASKRRSVLVLLRDAVDERVIPPLGKIRPVKQPAKIPEAWSVDEVRSLLRVANGNPWWEAFIRVSWDTALRLDDVLSLKLSNIGPDGSICLTQKKTGWLHSCRLNPMTLACVMRLARPGMDDLFRLECCRRTFFKEFRRLVKLAGIRPGSSKWLRRGSSTAVEAIQPGAAMAHLGHRTPGLAYQHYVDPRLLQTASPLPPEL